MCVCVCVCVCTRTTEVETKYPFFSQSGTHDCVQHGCLSDKQAAPPYLQPKLSKTHTNVCSTKQVDRKSVLKLFQDSKAISLSLKQFLKRGVVLAIFTLITLAVRLAVTDGGPTQKVINRWGQYVTM